MTATRSPSGSMPPGRSKRSRTVPEVVAYGRNILPVVESEAELPVIVSRAVGQGHVVLIGDTCFAMNKNLEYIGGQSFSGGYETAHFWRWLLTRLQDSRSGYRHGRRRVAQDSPDEDAVDSEEEEES